MIAHTRRRWLKTKILVGLLVGVAIAIGVMAWTSRTALQRVRDEADRADPGWRLDDLDAARFSPPDAENAALRVAKVKQLAPAGWLDYKLDERLSKSANPHRLTDKQIAAVDKLLAAAGLPALEAARSLIETPHGRYAIVWPANIFAFTLNCQDNRDATGLLRYDVQRLCERGEIDAALTSAHAAFHAGCSIGDEPTLISQLVRIACQAVGVQLTERVLSQGAPSEEKLAALQARFESEESRNVLLAGVRGERALMDRYIDALHNGDANISAMVGGGGGGGSGVLDFLIRIPGFADSQFVTILRMQNGVVEIARGPIEGWAELKKLPSQIGHTDILARLLLPAVDKVADACVRNHAMLRCGSAMLACERYRRRNSKWPTTFDEVVAAGLLKAVPIDPYDGKPLRLKRVADGLIVYSVGPDRVDDGGNLDPKKPVAPGTDFGYRLWDVESRRQPAKAPGPEDPPEDDDDKK